MIKLIHLQSTKQSFSLLPCMVLLLASVALRNEAHGQLIGNRTVGVAPGFNQPRSSGGNSGVASNTSPTISGRFVRGNRARNDFVGSNRTEQKGFVGATQAIGVGRVQSAVEGLRVANPKSVNRPLPSQPATGPYYPRLAVDFSSRDENSSRSEITGKSETVFASAQERVEKVPGANVNVVRVGGLAIVRGVAKDERTAELIVTLLGFEPGVDQVRNEMQIPTRP